MYSYKIPLTNRSVKLPTPSKLKEGPCCLSSELALLILLSYYYFSPVVRVQYSSWRPWQRTFVLPPSEMSDFATRPAMEETCSETSFAPNTLIEHYPNLTKAMGLPDLDFASLEELPAAESLTKLADVRVPEPLEAALSPAHLASTRAIFVRSGPFFTVEKMYEKSLDRLIASIVEALQLPAVARRLEEVALSAGHIVPDMVYATRHDVATPPIHELELLQENKAPTSETTEKGTKGKSEELGPDSASFPEIAGLIPLRPCARTGGELRDHGSRPNLQERQGAAHALQTGPSCSSSPSPWSSPSHA